MESGADRTYFGEAYRDYGAQNPIRKLDHYIDQTLCRVPNRPLHLLDIGCGLGSFLQRTAARFPEWTLHGTDIDPEAVIATRASLAHAEVVQASADEMPFPDGSFDVITAWDVLEHVLDREAVAAAVSAMLKPGGLFAFVVPVYDGITGPVIRRLDKDPTHVHKVSRERWLDWAKQHFVDVEWHGLTRHLVGRCYMHLHTETFRRHTPAIFVSARAN